MAQELKPDLVAIADPGRDWIYGWELDQSTQPGRVLLRLSTAVANMGDGPLEMWGGATYDDIQEVYQRIYDGNGTSQDRLAGTFIYHPSHGHIHFEGFAEYNLRSITAGGGVGPVVAGGDKVSFCLLNVSQVDPNLTNNAIRAHGRGGSNCGSIQGISVGYADVYGQNLPDQWIDVTNVPSGEYWLEAIADPQDRIDEINEDNNTVRIQISYTSPNGGPPTNQAPTAVLGTDVSSGPAPLTVEFNALGSSDPGGSLVGFDWNFGDGNTATGITATHTYNAAGTYTASLTVTDNEGLTATDMRTIIVGDGGSCAPLDFRNFTISPFSGQDAGSAQIQDGGATLFIQDNAWKSIDKTYTITAQTVLEFDFRSTEQGEIHDIGFATSNQYNENRFKLYGTQNHSSFNTEFTYTGNGAYQRFVIPVGQYFTGTMTYLYFTCDNDANPSLGNSYFRDVKIYEGSCQLAQTIDFPPILDHYTTDEPFDLSATASSGLPVSYTLVSGPATMNGNTVTLNGTEGVVVIRAEQAGDANYSAAPPVERSFEVTTPQPPSVVITQPTEGSTVNTADIVVNYTLSGNFPAYEANHLHITLDDNPHITIQDMTGTYTLTNVPSGPHKIKAELVTAGHVPLTIPEARDSVLITVNHNEQPTAVIAATPTSGSAPLEVDFDGSGSSDNNGSIVSYAWDFGDGNSGTGSTITHTYEVFGTFTASLTITDDQGFTHTASTIITVSPPDSPLKIESGVIANVGSDWQTISLDQSYNSPVIVATVVLENENALPAVSRIQNASGNSFELRVQNPSEQSLNGYTVHYVVVEEGIYTVADAGVKLEALKVTSSQTAHDSGWNLENRSYFNSYTNPVVLGQVMSENDGDWSVFWSSSSSVANPPSGTELSAGKHVGEDSDIARANETIGYIVMEAGSGTMGGVEYIAGLGADIVGGPNASGYTYSINGLDSPEAAILSASGMDGGNGGWPVLFGSTPLSASAITLAFDEDQLFDTERNHTTEQVSYLVLSASNVPPTAVLSANPISGDAPLQVSFDGSGSSDPDGTIVSHVWDFDDGNLANTAITTHTFTQAGTYNVSLTVSDDEGGSDVETVVITVNEAPTGPLCFQVSGGSVVMEAENYSAATPGTGAQSAFAWQAYNDPQASGGIAMRVPNGSGGGWTGLELTGPRLDYDINFPAAGTYRLWVRSSAPSNIDDSFHAGLNGVGLTNLSGTGMGNVVGDWGWADDANNGQNIELVINAPGKHTLNLWMREDGIQVDKIVISLDPTAPQGQGPVESAQGPCGETPNQNPVAAFSATPNGGEAPLPVSFDASASSDDSGIASYAWDFGDGTSGSGQTTSHTYSDAGTYTARLTVTDEEGAVDTETIQITVINPGSGVLCFVSSGGSVVIEAENYSAASAGTNGLENFSWESYNDAQASGGKAMRVPNGSGGYTGLNLNGPRLDYDITFAEAGTYRLWVRTSAPGSTDDSFHAGLDGTGYTNSSGYGMGNIVGNWGWSDEANSGQDVDLVVSTPGKHTLNIWMREDGIQIDKIVVSLDPTEPQGTGPAESTQQPCDAAPNQPPVASFSATPEAGEMPLEVLFDATASSDSDGSITTYNWEFGDGNTATGPTVSHTYTQEGIYTASLTVTDNDGATHTTETNISVVPDAANGLCFEESNGLLVMEAENYSRAVAGYDGLENHYWEIYNDNNASGQNAVRAVPNGTGGWSGLNLNGPRLDFDINFANPGTYRLWVRASAPSGIDDSFHAGMDGVGLTNLSGLGMAVNGAWAWTDEANGGQDINIEINAIGKHTFHLWMREDGVQVDKIVLALDPTQPIGTGSQQSALANCATNQAAPLQNPTSSGQVFGLVNPNPEDLEDFELLVYPNPFEREFFFEIQSRNHQFEQIDIRILDVMGREVYTQKDVRPNTRVQLGQQLTKGIYILRVIADGEPFDIKLDKL